MLNNKTIINLAPTGLVPTKRDNQQVPITIDEIVQDVNDCCELGVSIVHLHARHNDGAATSDPEVFRDIIRQIRERNSELIITVSTSGRVCSEFEQRAAVLDLDADEKPDMASLTLGSLNFHETASVNSPEVIQRLAIAMQERDIKPELEVFDLGMINYAKYLIKKDIIKPPYYFNIILGGVASAQANLSHLAMMVSDLPSDSVWCASGIGAAQLQMNTIGLTMGNGVRVGLEDNLWLDDERKQLASNVALVKRVNAIADLLGKTPATPLEVRHMLGLRINNV